MNTVENIHGWFEEQVAAYLAGGLDAEETTRFEEHARSCAACGQLLQRMRGEDETLQALFAGDQADGELEDRIIQRVRLAMPARRWVHPLVKRAAGGVAAAVLLGALGYMGMQAMEKGRMTGVAVDLAGGPRLVHATTQPAQWQYFFSEAGNDADHRLGLNISGLSDSNKRSAEAADGDGIADGVSLPKSGGGTLTLTGSNTYTGETTVQSGTLRVSNGTLAAPTGERDKVDLNTLIKLPKPRFEGTPSNLPPIIDHYQALRKSGETDWKESKDAKPSGGEFYDGGHATGKPQGEASRGWSYYDAKNKEQTSADGQRGLHGKTEDSSQRTGDQTVAGNGKVIASSTDLGLASDLGDLRDSAGRKEANGRGGVVAVAAVDPNQPVQPPRPQVQDAQVQRKIIRNGEMDFEVESFDVAYMTIGKIVVEDGGFVATTDSQKLPNGKVRGVVTVRIAPDRLDLLVLKLRALGELKSQKLTAQDVTKQYTDTESQLRAARAMEERLLKLIQEGKGQIKDLIAAEKELGTWREKIEKYEGEIRYYNSLVSLSTLNISLTEKDIKTAASAAETESINAGLQTEDVEKTRDEAIKAIEEAKGRIIESQLKKYEGGQLSSQIVADVPPDASGPLIDRLRQLGKLTRLDMDRRQTAQEGKVVLPKSRIERQDTRLTISIYNLANISPRETIQRSVVAPDVSAAHAKMLSAAAESGAKVLTSQLDEKDRLNVSSTLDLEVPQAQLETIEKAIGALGDTVARNVSRSSDVQNTTESKILVRLSLFSADRLMPRETTMAGLEVADVEAAMRSLQAISGEAGGRTVESHLSKERSGRMAARVVLDVPLNKSAAVVDKIKAMGTVRVIEATKNPQVPEGSLTRARIELTLGNAEAIVSGDQNLGSSLRQGLGTSVQGLLWSLQVIVVGLCLAGPWALLLWGGWKVIRRKRKAT